MGTSSLKWHIDLKQVVKEPFFLPFPWVDFKSALLGGRVWQSHFCCLYISNSSSSYSKEAWLTPWVRQVKVPHSPFATVQRHCKKELALGLPFSGSSGVCFLASCDHQWSSQHEAGWPPSCNEWSPEGPRAGFRKWFRKVQCILHLAFECFTRVHLKTYFFKMYVLY